MKKLLLLFLLIFICTTTSAQLTKGNWLVGGSGSFSSVTSKYENNSGNKVEIKGTRFNLNPNIGYFFVDKFVAGLDVNLDYGNPSGSDNSNWSMDIGPFLRYYFLEANKRFNIFSEASYTYGTGLSKINNDNKSTNFNFGAGCELFFNSTVGLELAVNYIDGTSKTDSRTSDVDLNQIYISLGFQIHLKK